MIVLSLFDYSTNFVQPWAEAGYLCYSVDLQHPAGETRAGNIIRVGADMLDFLPPQGDYAFCAAFPPCTHLAVSGARWFKGKGLSMIAESIRLFHRSAQICEWTGAPFLIENPVSTISTYWRPPDHTFDPCDYGDPWRKKTCLWTGGGFVMPPTSPVLPTLGSKMHRLPPGPNRANLRSETPTGFANAVFAANGPPLVTEEVNPCYQPSANLHSVVNRGEQVVVNDGIQVGNRRPAAGRGSRLAA